MTEWLGRKSVSLGTYAFRFPEWFPYHLIGVPSGDLFGVALRMGQVPTLAQEIQEIEQDVRLVFNKGTTKIGSSFSLTQGKSKHSDYVTDLKIADAKNLSPAVEGKDVTIAVVDTGVESSGVLKSPTDFIDLFDEKNTSCNDTVGHGTAMIKIIRDVAPQAQVFAIRVTDTDGVNLWDVMAGINTAVFDNRVNADIVNLSLGLEQIDRYCNQCGSHGSNRLKVFESMLDKIRKLGNPDPIFVASVGNNKSNKGFDWPARYLSTTVAVGAVNSKWERSSFSNLGTSKDDYLMCPGGDWDYVKNKEAEWVGEGFEGKDTTFCLGTSPAAAYASAVLALYREHLINEVKRNQQGTTVSAKELMKEVYKRCKNDVVNYRKTDHGVGRLVFDASSYSPAGPGTSP